MVTPKKSNWVADFETTTLEDDCRVWGWGLTNIDTTDCLEDVEIGTDMKSFINRISEMSSTVYFHNLRFDGSFIVDWLLREGFKYSDNNSLRRGEFSTLISKMGSWYSVTVQWENGRKTEFRDSHKKLPMPLEQVAKAFKLPVAKGEIDYDATRPVGHIITSEEDHYIRLDVFIIAMALQVQFDSGLKKMTVGSDALGEYKKLQGSRLFQKLFPVLNNSMDAEIRSAYKGGFTYSDKRFSKKITRSGIVYDVNSLYPSVMYDRVLPFDEPEYVETLPRISEAFPLFLVSITFTAKLKPNHIPCIQIKNSIHFGGTEYQTNITDPATLMCTNIDLALWEDHYDMNIISYNGGWSFRGNTGFFTEYIDKWMKIKQENEGGVRELAKLQLNSLYGKFASNPDITGKYPVLENNIVKLKEGPEEIKNPVYTAMGVFITAYARDVTIRAAQQHYDVFAYADTDSLHLLVDDDPPTLDIDPKKLGAWKREYRFTAGMFIRAKQYVEHVGPENCELEEHAHDESCGHLAKDCDMEAHTHISGCEYVVHVAGLPRKVAKQITFADVMETRRFEGKLTPKRVPGGIILKDDGFTLNM